MFGHLLVLMVPLLGSIVCVLLLHLAGERGAQGIAVKVESRRYVGGLAKSKGHAMRLRKHGGGGGDVVGLQRLRLWVMGEMGRGLLTGPEV